MKHIKNANIASIFGIVLLVQLAVIFVVGIKIFSADNFLVLSKNVYVTHTLGAENLKPQDKLTAVFLGNDFRKKVTLFINDFQEPIRVKGESSELSVFDLQENFSKRLSPTPAAYFLEDNLFIFHTYTGSIEACIANHNEKELSLLDFACTSFYSKWVNVNDKIQISSVFSRVSWILSHLSESMDCNLYPEEYFTYAADIFISCDGLKITLKTVFFLIVGSVFTFLSFFLDIKRIIFLLKKSIKIGVHPFFLILPIFISVLFLPRFFQSMISITLLSAAFTELFVAKRRDNNQPQ